MRNNCWQQCNNAYINVTITDRNVTNTYINVTIAGRNVTNAYIIVTIAGRNVTNAYIIVTIADRNVTNAYINVTIADRNVTNANINVTNAYINVTIVDRNVTAAYINVTTAYRNVTNAYIILIQNSSKFKISRKYWISCCDRDGKMSLRKVIRIKKSYSEVIVICKISRTYTYFNDYDLFNIIAFYQKKNVCLYHNTRARKSDTLLSHPVYYSFEYMYIRHTIAPPCI